MRAPHKHADIIKAWADGAEIQVYDTHNEVWRNSPTPIWDSGLKYRVFVEPEPDVVMTRRVSVLVEPSAGEPNGLVNVTAGFSRNVRFVFDGETRELKSVELIK